jgi:putative endonuclease
MYFSYIIFSASSDVFYKGFSSNPQQRLWEHNNNLSHYTAGKGPWTLIYIKEFRTKREALIDEKRLKKLNRRSIELLIKEYLTLNGNLNP